MGRRVEIDLEELQVLYNQRLSDEEIGKILGCSRKTVTHRREELGLPKHYRGSSIWNQEEEVRRMFTEGKSGAEIQKILGVSHSMLTKFKKERGIKGMYEMKMTPEDINRAMQMAEEGMMDSEIAKEFGVTAGNIQIHRKNRGIKSQFTYDKISKINNEKFEELFNQGLGDEEIGKALGMTSDGIYAHRMRHGYYRESHTEAKNNPLTQDNLEIILGIMMGDGSMSNNYKNANFSIAHCPAQKEYRDYIVGKLSNLHPHTWYAISKPHPKTGKCYESYWVDFPSNPAFNEICDHFYVNRKKRIPFELFDNFTWQSLAYMYMDDGSRASSGARLATNCFTREELSQFQEFLLDKFGIETSYCKDNTLYIKAKSFKIMKTNIQSYVCECMRYKIR